MLCVVTACTGLGNQSGDEVLTPEEEARIGAAAHGEIVSQFGGVYSEPRLDSYLATLVRRLGTASGETSPSHRVTVLDTHVVNAFASPGGYIYVTRGLLSLANDEAELASVMAHEIGHLTAHHSARRQIEAARVSLLGGVLSSLSGSPYLSEALSLGSESYVAKYSRDQELEADEAGIATATQAGYDPFSASTFLTNLERYFDLDRQLTGVADEGGGSDLLSTHPSTPERIEHARTAAYQMGDAPVGYMRNQEIYFDLIDGLPYGDNPRHGVVENRTFSHPELRFRFEVPEGFEPINRNDVVLARGPEDAVIIFDSAELDSGTSLSDHVVDHWGEGLDLRNTRELDVNGMNAVSAETLHRGFGHELVAIQHSETIIYRFLFITRPIATATYERAFGRTVNSFRRLSEREALAIQPLRVRIVETEAGDTVARLARRMASGERQEERFRILNGLGPEEELEPGQRVKLILH
jgi:predicted Zn-dependent protease